MQYSKIKINKSNDGNLLQKQTNMFDLINEIVTFGPRMAHDDTIETLYYAQMHAFPPSMRKDGESRKWYKPKKQAKHWIVA